MFGDCIIYIYVQDENIGIIEIVINYINEYQDGKFYNELEKNQLFEYINLVKLRSTGELMTGAQWQRNFALNHKLYKKDSNISEPLCRCLTDLIDDVVHGRQKAPKLLGDNIDIAARRENRIKVDIESHVHNFKTQNDSTDKNTKIESTTEGNEVNMTNISNNKSIGLNQDPENHIVDDMCQCFLPISRLFSKNR